MEINIKLNEELCLNSIITMETKVQNYSHSQSYAQYMQSQIQTQNHYYNVYIKEEMNKGRNEFQASVNFLMDESVPQKYKDIYRKSQNQMVEAMDLDEYPDPPKLKYTKR